MTKKVLLAIASLTCIAALTACSAQPAKTSSVGAAVALESQPAKPSSTPIQTATSALSDEPSSSLPAGATKKPSAQPDSSAGAPAESGSIEQVIDADDVNQRYASDLKTEGEDIKVTIQSDTLTFNVKLDQDIKPADFTADMQSQYEEDMNRQIQTIISEYPNIPNCAFVYNLTNQSGEVLMNQTQFYQAE